MQREIAPPKGEYVCERCNIRSFLDAEYLVCPACGNDDADLFHPYYVEDEKERHELITDKDLGEGD